MISSGRLAVEQSYAQQPLAAADRLLTGRHVLLASGDYDYT